MEKEYSNWRVLYVVSCIEELAPGINICKNDHALTMDDDYTTGTYWLRCTNLSRFDPAKLIEKCSKYFELRDVKFTLPPFDMFLGDEQNNVLITDIIEFTVIHDNKGE